MTHNFRSLFRTTRAKWRHNPYIRDSLMVLFSVLKEQAITLNNLLGIVPGAAIAIGVLGGGRRYSPVRNVIQFKFTMLSYGWPLPGSYLVVIFSIEIPSGWLRSLLLLYYGYRRDDPSSYTFGNVGKTRNLASGLGQDDAIDIIVLIFMPQSG